MRNWILTPSAHFCFNLLKLNSILIIYVSFTTHTTMDTREGRAGAHFEFGPEWWYSAPPTQFFPPWIDCVLPLVTTRLILTSESARTELLLTVNSCLGLVFISLSMQPRPLAEASMQSGLSTPWRLENVFSTNPSMKGCRHSLDTDIEELRERSSEAPPPGANAACNQSPVISRLRLRCRSHLSDDTVWEKKEELCLLLSHSQDPLLNMSRPTVDYGFVWRAI